MKGYFPSRPGIHRIHSCLCSPRVGPGRGAVCGLRVGQPVTCAEARGTKDETGVTVQPRGEDDWSLTSLRLVLCQARSQPMEAVGSGQCLPALHLGKRSQQYNKRPTSIDRLSPKHKYRV